MEKSSALIIFSGGQDSATSLYWAKDRFERVEALTFEYGQVHSIEIESAVKICRDLSVPQKIISLDMLSQLNANALTDKSIEAKNDGGFGGLPSTFVPGRNALFLTLATAYAVPRGMLNLVMGVCQTDYSGYPDCREEFILSMEKSLGLALGVKIKIHTPLMHLTKAQTFSLAEELGCLDVVIRDTHTCYKGDRGILHRWGFGCGECPACELRKRGYEEFSI